MARLVGSCGSWSFSGVAFCRLKHPLIRRSISASDTSRRRIISSLAAAPSSCSQPLQVPLFLKPPIHAASLSDLRKWYAWADSLAVSVGSSFLCSDNGPDSTLLCRELRWLLEDALPESTDLSPLIRRLSDENPDAVVNLKAGIEELYNLWRQRIEERRPFQYIVGCEHWRDLVLCVQEGVLIPRPETEILVDLVVDAASRDKDRGESGGVWADLGTGSGAIAIGIARALAGNRCRGNAKVIATDLSPMAVKVASFNVSRYCLQDLVEVREGSWFEPLEEYKGKLDGFVSNPPYIPSTDIPGLQAEVGRHEPLLALHGGVDGLDDLLHLCSGAALMLRPGGCFAFETNGEKQCEFLVQHMEDIHRGRFSDVRVISDFAGVKRFITGFRR